jgi:hypothetical protein
MGCASSVAVNSPAKKSASSGSSIVRLDAVELTNLETLDSESSASKVLPLSIASGSTRTLREVDGERGAAASLSLQSTTTGTKTSGSTSLSPPSVASVVVALMRICDSPQRSPHLVDSVAEFQPQQLPYDNSRERGAIGTITVLRDESGEVRSLLVISGSLEITKFIPEAAEPETSKEFLLASSKSGHPSPRIHVRIGRKYLIGSGANAKVYRASDEAGVVYALKLIRISQSRQYCDFAVAAVSEIRALSRLSHPNIVRYFGVTALRSECCESEEWDLGILLELCGGGSMTEFIATYFPNGLDYFLLQRFLIQLLSAIDYLHSHGVYHRDIKPANILFGDSDHENIRVADFGSAIYANRRTKEGDVGGTPVYMPPESLLSPSTEGAACLAHDVWSIGCTALELATGRPPWDGSELQPFSNFRLLAEIARVKVLPIPSTVPDNLRRFIAACTAVDPQQRANISQLRAMLT